MQIDPVDGGAAAAAAPAEVAARWRKIGAARIRTQRRIEFNIAYRHLRSVQFDLFSSRSAAINGTN